MHLDSFIVHAVLIRQLVLPISKNACETLTVRDRLQLYSPLNLLVQIVFVCCSLSQVPPATKVRHFDFPKAGREDDALTYEVRLFFYSCSCQGNRDATVLLIF